MFEFGVKPHVIAKDGSYWTTAEPEYWYENVPVPKWCRTYCLQKVEAKKYCGGFIKIWKRKPHWMEFESKDSLLDFGKIID